LITDASFGAYTPFEKSKEDRKLQVLTSHTQNVIFILILAKVKQHDHMAEAWRRVNTNLTDDHPSPHQTKAKSEFVH
jgi:hypothetical protein